MIRDPSWSVSERALLLPRATVSHGFISLNGDSLFSMGYSLFRSKNRLSLFIRFLVVRFLLESNVSPSAPFLQERLHFLHFRSSGVGQWGSRSTGDKLVMIARARKYMAVEKAAPLCFHVPFLSWLGLRKYVSVFRYV